MAIRHRSPNYPGTDLEESIQVLTPLYQGVGRGQFTPADAAKAWSYNSTAGPVKIRLAALRQFGLIEGKKGEHRRLSARALTLILRNQASREYQQALREAAFTPQLFADLDTSMPGAAPDALRQHLIVERSFTDEGANRLIEVFKSTMNLAKPHDYDNMEAHDTDDDSEEEDEMVLRVQPPRSPPPASAPPTDPDTRSVVIPLPGTTWATLKAPFPISTTNWDQMMNMLNALKPGLTSDVIDMLDEDDE